MVKQQFACLLLAVLAVAVDAQQRYQPNWASLDARPLPDWYDKAKIGIFLHWGVYSVPAYRSEWIGNGWHTRDPKLTGFIDKVYGPNFKYEDLAKQFHAEFFNPNEWAELFRKSGAKYIVPTSKHHEGYQMWDTKYSPNWNAMEVGPKRDLIGELATAVRAHNLTFGVYHSLLEWFDPRYQKDKANQWTTHEYVHQKLRPSLEELVTKYKPHLIFADGEWEQEDTYWNSTDFLAWLYNESPVKDQIVVNDRWGKSAKCHHGGYFNCDDRFNPGKLQTHKFETALTVDRGSWGYRREGSLADIVQIEGLLTQIAKAVSCGGNILINVGPRADGKIPIIFEERLLELGAWLQVNGESIYESKPWIHQEDSVTKNLWYTQRAGHVYGIVNGYHARIEFGSVDFAKVTSVHLLGHGTQPIHFEKSATGSHVSIQMPVLTPDSPAKHAYVFRFEMMN